MSLAKAVRSSNWSLVNVQTHTITFVSDCGWKAQVKRSDKSFVKFSHVDGTETTYRGDQVGKGLVEKIDAKADKKSYFVAQKQKAAQQQKAAQSAPAPTPTHKEQGVHVARRNNSVRTTERSAHGNGTVRREADVKSVFNHNRSARKGAYRAY